MATREASKQKKIKSLLKDWPNNFDPAEWAKLFPPCECEKHKAGAPQWLSDYSLGKRECVWAVAR